MATPYRAMFGLTEGQDHARDGLIDESNKEVENFLHNYTVGDENSIGYGFIHGDIAPWVVKRVVDELRSTGKYISEPDDELLYVKDEDVMRILADMYRRRVATQEELGRPSAYALLNSWCKKCGENRDADIPPWEQKYSSCMRCANMDTLLYHILPDDKLFRALRKTVDDAARSMFSKLPEKYNDVIRMIVAGAFESALSFAVFGTIFDIYHYIEGQEDNPRYFTPPHVITEFSGNPLSNTIMNIYIHHAYTACGREDVFYDGDAIAPACDMFAEDDSVASTSPEPHIERIVIKVRHARVGKWFVC